VSRDAYATVALGRASTGVSPGGHADTRWSPDWSTSVSRGSGDPGPCIPSRLSTAS